MKIGMLFPGYGSQYVGMGKELYDDSRVMQEYFEEASNCVNLNFVKLCFASSDTEIGRMEHAYPALFLMSSAIAALLKQEGIQADIAIGYNTGEYAAIHAAGGISFPDGLYLLSKYHTMYQELLVTSEVAAIRVAGLTSSTLENLCETACQGSETASIAIYDSLLTHIVTGTTEAVEQVRLLIREHDNVIVDDEPLEIGLHSALMDPVAVHLKIYLEKVDFKDLAVPLVTNADAKMVIHNGLVKTALVKQIFSPVLWQQGLELLKECDIIIEVGPGSYLSTLAQKRYPDKKCIAINKKSDIQELKEIIRNNQEPSEE